MKMQPFLPWSQLKETINQDGPICRSVCFYFLLHPWGTVLPFQGPWLRMVSHNSHWLPELFSTALSTTHSDLLPGAPDAGGLHQLLSLRKGSGRGLCSFSRSFSLDLAGCMQISVNAVIWPPHPPHNHRTRASQGSCAPSGDCALPSRPLPLMTTFLLPLGWVTCRVNPRK